MSGNPRLSVIVPVLNGARYIGPFVAALKEQDASADLYEVVVIDNGSNDHSVELLEQAARSTNLRVISFTELKSSYAARNFGVRQSLAQVLAFTDIDCRPAADWIARCLAASVRDGAEQFVISGRVEIFPQGEQFSPVEWYDASNYLRQDNAACGGAGLTANLVIPRGIFNVLGGFVETTSGGDGDFCRRALQAGYRLHFDPSMVVLHPARSGIAEMASKLRRVARGIRQLTAQSAGCRQASVKLVVKHLTAVVLQPQLWRTLRSACRDQRFSTLWLARLVGVSVVLGTYLRLCLLRELLPLMLIGPRGER